MEIEYVNYNNNKCRTQLATRKVKPISTKESKCWAADLTVGHSSFSTSKTARNGWSSRSTWQICPMTSKKLPWRKLRSCRCWIIPTSFVFGKCTELPKWNWTLWWSTQGEETWDIASRLPRRPKFIFQSTKFWSGLFKFAWQSGTSIVSNWPLTQQNHPQGPQSPECFPHRRGTRQIRRLRSR